MRDEEEVKAGWGPINLNFLFKPWAWLTVVWHDNITLKNSFAVRACIKGSRVAEAWRDQLRHKARGLWQKLVSGTAGPVMKHIQPPWYEGPETDAEREECLIREGRNPDGTKRRPD